MRGKYYKIQLRNSKYKHYFQREENITKFSYKIQNINITFNTRKILQISVTEFKTQNITFNSRKLLQIPVTKIQNHKRYLNVSRNIIT